MGEDRITEAAEIMGEACAVHNEKVRRKSKKQTVKTKLRARHEPRP